MAVVNLTPHEVVVWHDDDPMGEKTSYPASGEVARLGTIDLGTQHYDIGAPVELVEFGHLVKSPPKVEGTWYIVSLPCALACPHRADFLVPYLEVRDDAGRIVGCHMLARPV